MIVYIITDKAKDGKIGYRYAETRKVYTDMKAAATEYLRLVGGRESLFGMLPNMSAGQANIYKCGDTDVEMIALETDSRGVPGVTLDDAISDYHQITQELAATSKRLDRLLDAQLKLYDDEEELADLAYELPSGYEGRQRVCARMHQLQDEKAQEAKK